MRPAQIKVEVISDYRIETKKQRKSDFGLMRLLRRFFTLLKFWA